MNKVFRIIWNHTLQRFDVTSELARRQSKASSTDKREKLAKALLVAGLFLSMTAGSAVAANYQPTNSKNIGSVSDNTGSHIAIGDWSKVEYRYDVSNREYKRTTIDINDEDGDGDYIENNSLKATSRLIGMAGGIAIGSEATVTEKGENGIAIGSGALSDGQMAGALGFWLKQGKTFSCVRLSKYISW